MRKYIKYIILILGFFVLSLFSTYLLYYQNFDSFPVTDINQQFLFSDTLIDGQGLTYSNSLNLSNRYSAIFGIRNLLIKNGLGYPTAFLGLIVIWGMLKLISPYLIAFLNPFMWTIAAFYFYKIISLFLNNESVKNLGLILFFFSAPFFLYAVLPYNNIFSTAIFIINLYFLLKLSKQLKINYAILFSLLLGIQLWIRPIDIIFYVPLLFWILYKNKKKIKSLIKPFLISGIIFAFFLIPLMIVNDNIYGSVIGQYNLENKNILTFYRYTPIQENIHFSLAIFLNVIENKFYLLNPLLVIFSCLGIILFKKKKDKIFSLVLLTIFLLQIILFGFKNWSGFNLGYSVGDSFTRYTLISWCILLFYCLYFFDKIRWRAKRMVPLMFLVYFLITNIYLMSMTPFGYYGWRHVSRWIYKYDKPFFNSSPKTILFTGLYEKYLYPSVTPAIYTAFPKKYRAEKTADLMNKLLEDGYLVYFIHDTVPELDFGKGYYFDTFTQKKLSFELVRKIYNKQDLYKIIQKNE